MSGGRRHDEHCARNCTQTLASCLLTQPDTAAGSAAPGNSADAAVGGSLKVSASHRGQGDSTPMETTVHFTLKSLSFPPTSFIPGKG